MHVFYSCDLILDPMTLLYELNLTIVMLYLILAYQKLTFYVKVFDCYRVITEGQTETETI